MDDKELRQLIDENMEDIRHEIAAFCVDFERATRFVEAAIRARKHTIKLQSLFKIFRKLTCQAGLK